MAPFVQVVFLIDVNYFKQWNSKYLLKFEHWKSKLYLCCLRLLTEFGAQTDKENVRWAFKFYNSKKFKPDLSHKVFSDFTITSLKKFEEEINNITSEKHSVIENSPRSQSRSRTTFIKSINPTVNKQLHTDGANKNNNSEKNLESSKYSHSYILNKSLQEILLDYDWDSLDISSPVKGQKASADNRFDRSSRNSRPRSSKKSTSEIPAFEGLNFVIAFTDVPRNVEEISLFIGKNSGESSGSELFKNLFDQATLHGFKDEKKLRFHLVNISNEKVDSSLKASLQIDLNKLYGGLHEIDNLVQDAEEKVSDILQKKKSSFTDTSVFINNQYKNIKGTELCTSNLHWWNKKRVSSRSRVPQPGPLLVWEDMDGVSFLKIQLELLSIQGSCSKQWEDIHVKGLLRGNAMNLLGIGCASSLLYVCHAPDTIFPVVLKTLSEQNLFMILQMESGGLVGLAPWVGGVGCLVLFSSTQLISPLTKCKSPSSLDDALDKGITKFVLSAIKKILKNVPEMSNRPESSSSKKFQPQMTRNWYPVNEVSLEKLNMRPPKRSSLEQAMLERLQKKYRPQMPRPLSGSHLPPQSLIDVTQPAAAAAVPDVPPTLTVTANLRSSKINVSRAQKLVKNSKIVTAQMRVKELQAEEQEQQAACERKTIEAQNRAKKSIAIVAKTMKGISNPQDKDELAQALIRLRDNPDSVSEIDNSMVSEDLYSTAQSVVDLALMHIKRNFDQGPNSVESELRDVLSREVLLSAKQVCKCEEKSQPRQFKLQTLLLLEVLWILGYSRPNVTTPNKRKSPRKKKDIGEEYTEEILKLLRMMSLKYDPATVGEFLRHTVVPNYQESLGEILVEIFEELNLPLPASLAPYANGEDDLVSPAKPMSVKSHASSVSNGPNSCENGGINGVKEGTKPSTRPLLKRETSRQIIVPHVKRPLQRVNTMKEQNKTKAKGSSKRELKSVCRNLFDKRDKLKRSHTVASFGSSRQRTPSKKRKHSEIKSPLKTPLRSMKKREMSTPNSTKAKILVPETPAHAVKTTVFNKRRLLKSTGSTLIVESPDIKGESRTTNIPRRLSLPLTRRASFYSGASSRNFEKGKHQLRVSRIRGQLERRSSFSNSDSLNGSFIFSEIIQKNNRMELESSVRPEEEKDKFFCKEKLTFGLDDEEEVEPHRPSLSGRKRGKSQRVWTPQKGEVDSPLKKVRRSLSLMTPVKGNDSLSLPASNAVSKVSTSMEFARIGSPGKLRGCINSNEASNNSAYRKSTRNRSPCRTLENTGTPKKHHLLLSPNKTSDNGTPRKSPRGKIPSNLTNNATSAFFDATLSKLTENGTTRKSSRIEGSSKFFQNSILAADPPGIVDLCKLSQTTPRKSPRKSPCKSSDISEKQSKIPNSKTDTTNKLSGNLNVTPRKSVAFKKCFVRLTPRNLSRNGVSSPNRHNYLSPYKLNKFDGSCNSPFMGSAKNEFKLTCDELFDNDNSNSSFNFIGFGAESENNSSSGSLSEVLKDNITGCLTPGKRVQFSFDSTPTKNNTSESKSLTGTPKSILKTPSKSPGKTPIKIRSLEEKDVNVFTKRGLEITPNKSNTSNYFKKPSPFLFSPKLAFDAYTPPIQKENVIPSTVVNELFKNSTPTHFEALLHSPITSVERRNTSADKIGLVKKATNSHMKSHRKLQLPLCSPSKKSPKKRETNWEFREILNSPKKFLLDSCTEFEMVSPSKKCVSSVKADLVFHKDQDERTINKVVEMSFQEEEKVIQELPVDQVDLRLEPKIDEGIPGHFEEQCEGCISKNGDSHIPKETWCNPTNDCLESLEYEFSYKEQTEPRESMEYDFSSEYTEPVAEVVRDVKRDLHIMASLLNGLEKNGDEKISESEIENNSQKFEPFYRKISHQDSDSGISVSNINEPEIYLKEDINNLISFLASPCKMTSKAVEVCEQSIISSISNDRSLDSSKNSSCNEISVENVPERDPRELEMLDKGNELDKFSASNACLGNISENDQTDSITHSFLGFPDYRWNSAEISHDDGSTLNTEKNTCIFECEDINTSLITQTDEVDVESRDSPVESHDSPVESHDSPVINPSDTEDEKEIKEYPDIDPAHFCNVGKVAISFENKISDFDVTDQTDMNANYNMSPEIPLDINVCQYSKEKVVDIFSTKRKLVFMSGEIEENRNECGNIQENLEPECVNIQESLEPECVNIQESLHSECVNIQESLEPECVNIQVSLESECGNIQESLETECVNIQESLEPECINIQESLHSECVNIQESLKPECVNIQVSLESECVNVQESLEPKCKKIKLIGKDSEMDIKSVNSISESQTLSCDIGSTPTLMENVFAHQPEDNTKINSLNTEEGVLVKQALQCQSNSIPVISEAELYEEANAKIASEFEYCRPSTSQYTSVDAIQNPIAILCFPQPTLHRISEVVPTCTIDTFPSRSCSNHSNASLSHRDSISCTPCNSLSSTAIYQSAPQGVPLSSSGDSPTRSVLPADSCARNVSNASTLSNYHGVHSNVLHSSLPSEPSTCEESILVHCDTSLSGTSDTTRIVSNDIPITSHDPSTDAAQSTCPNVFRSSSSVIYDILPSAADGTSTFISTPDKGEGKLHDENQDSNFLHSEISLDVENSDIFENIAVSSIKANNIDSNVTSPSTSLKGLENVTPRRSNRKGRQTSFFESPINLDGNNYDLISPVFSSRKKKESKLASKLRRTSRKLSYTQSEEPDGETQKEIQDHLLPYISEEVMPLEEEVPLSAEKADCSFPRGRLSDSFEVVSPMKNITTFEKEHLIPEEQKSPIVIRIRRRKKAKPSPMRLERASKIKALKNIEKDIEAENEKDELIL